MTINECGNDEVTLFTDENDRTWHILRREGGSISFYYTHPHSHAHYVVHDTLDNKPPSPYAQQMLARLTEMYTAIDALLAETGALSDK